MRVRLQMDSRVRELALFNFGIDSKLRGCDLVSLEVRDVCHGDQVASRAIVVQHKTQRSVQFEITPAARDAVQAWIKLARWKPEDFPLSQPAERLTPPRDPAVRQDFWALGRRTGARPRRLRDALDAQDECDVDLPTHQKPSRRAAAARAFETGIDGAIPRHRGRCRSRNLRADRDLTL